MANGDLGLVPCSPQSGLRYYAAMEIVPNVRARPMEILASEEASPTAVFSRIADVGIAYTNLACKGIRPRRGALEFI